MVTGVDSSTSQQVYFRERENYKMTDEQKEKVTELLKKYDSSNMTEESMKSLMEEIKSLGVKPGDDLKELMDEAGFKPQKPPEGGMRPQGTEEEELPDFIEEFLEKYKAGTYTQEDLNNFITELKANGMDTSGSIIDSSI
jgi:ferritin-like protein